MPSSKRYRVIACRVFRPEYGRLRGQLPRGIEHQVTWLDVGLHREPQRLHDYISREIEAADRSDEYWDAILLLYGLCSRSIVGLSSTRHTLVVARAHDCITLFLGSKERYREEFERAPGTYWLTNGFLRGIEPGFSETHEGIYLEYEKRYEAYLEQFGDHELARYIVEHREQAWIRNYTRGVYVASGLDDDDGLREKARAYCTCRGWEFTEIAGGDGLLRNLLTGAWDTAQFLVVPPGDSIAAGTVRGIVATASRTAPLP